LSNNYQYNIKVSVSVHRPDVTVAICYVTP